MYMYIHCSHMTQSCYYWYYHSCRDLVGKLQEVNRLHVSQFGIRTLLRYGHNRYRVLK